MSIPPPHSFSFFFNDTATTEIYTLSLHDALPISLGRLIAIAENYPQLKSNENFRALQDQLEGTENRIAVARQDYNESVNAYNAYIRRFPQVLTAKVLGKKPRPYFELQTPGAAETPKVDFSH